MKRTRNKKLEDVPLNMTPMIDVVFQLIIFFMLVTEMAQADLEVLSLPSASEASPDHGEDRLTVNILAPEGDGTTLVKVRGKALDGPALYRYLRNAASLRRDPEDPRLSTLPLIIRADRRAEFRFVQHVMQECVKPGVGIWKIQIAAAEPKR